MFTHNNFSQKYQLSSFIVHLQLAVILLILNCHYVIISKKMLASSNIRTKLLFCDLKQYVQLWISHHLYVSHN